MRHRSVAGVAWLSISPGISCKLECVEEMVLGVFVDSLCREGVVRELLLFFFFCCFASSLFNYYDLVAVLCVLTAVAVA